ncbi:MAG TPA: DegT/DnrJ/EryC1/StrS family aminotransferase [Treponemataceae bacterium]|nr:DegT/DnrJ/EryC1/StrS family aminotransferase [Treponemataceae bacterium]HOQ92948.1 DegT/DnrJ/EryC1/StrS family aminotransferase [Treponemataceae bacterium]
MKIPTFSSTIRRKEMDSVLTTLVDEKIGPGEAVIRLIQQVKAFFGVDGAVALRSPSLALKYALKALDIPKGSKVIVSALAPYWQYVCLEEEGYEPLVIDVSPETALLSPETVLEAVKEGGSLLILHAAMGFVPNIQALLDIGLPIIEDISQSAGASLNEKMLGTFGVFSILGLEEEDSITGGGGAVLMAPERRNWIVLKKHSDEALSTDILPDINASLALVQLKEFNKNEQIRKEMYEIYARSIMQGKHKTFLQAGDYAIPTVYSFPVILSSGFKDVRQYALRKDIEIAPVFAQSIIAYKEEELSDLIHAKSFLLRCAYFPLYPRLGAQQAAKIAKVLATLP